MTEGNGGEIEELFFCKYCSYETAAIDELDEHIVQHDEALLDDNWEVSNNTDNNCSITFKDNSCQFETNEESTSKLILVCPFCEYLIDSRIAMKRHLQKHIDPTGVFTYVCSECAYETIRRSDITKHLFVHITNNHQNTINGIPSYKCEICSYTTIKKWCLTKHMMVHKNPNETTIFSCDLCKYFTKRRSDMAKHLKIHIK